METILKEVNAVVGVIGSFVCQSDNGVIAKAVPANIDAAQLDLAARVTVQTFDALEASGQKIHDVDLSFENGRLFLKNLDNGILAIFCQRNINIPLLNLAANAAVKKLSAQLKSAPRAQPAQPSAAPVSVAPAPTAISETPLPANVAELVHEARCLIDEAAHNRLRLRVMNNVAIWLACPRYRALLPAIDQNQIDFGAPAGDSQALEILCERLGYAGEKWFNTFYGNRRLHFAHQQRELVVDIYLDKFEMFHSIDLIPFLSDDEVMLPPTALALSRLQYVEIGDAELRQLCVLLLENDLSIGNGKNRIDAGYITRLCTEDWGWFKTVSMNLDRAINFAASNLPAAEHAIVTERAQRLRQSIDTAPKSLRWQTRARLGTSVKWYETPLVYRPGHERPDMALG